MTLGPRFWRTLETCPGRAGVAAYWQNLAGEAWPAVQGLLAPTGTRATAYPAPLPGGRAWRVVYHADGTRVAVDPADPTGRRDLAPADVVVYRLNLAQLRQALGGALAGVHLSRTPLETAGTRFAMGRWEPGRTGGIPVYLLLCPHRGELLRELQSLIAGGVGPGAVVWTPTQASWDEATDTVAQRHRLWLVALCDVVVVEGGAWRSTPVWQETCLRWASPAPGLRRRAKPAPIRGTRLANIEKLEKELENHLRAARDHAHARLDRGQEAALLPRPTQTELGQLAGLSPSDVSRCLADTRARVLQILWSTAASLDGVLHYKLRR